MSEYVDTKLINCNRLASIESRSGNDSNPAVFTNPLNETIKLDVGDKVSLERAFISEVGAGNPSTIEFKGVSRGSNKVATYTDIQYNEHYYNKTNTYDPKYRLGYYRSITTTEVTNDEVDLRDNLAPLVIGYYITSNEYPNYVQQPRRFTSNYTRRGSVARDLPKAYTDRDSEAQGLPLGLFTVNSECPCFADYTKKEEAADATFFKQKVDNTRYTLFIKDKIAYSVGATHDKAQMPQNNHNGVFSEARYYRVREKLNIEVNKGFNTPSAVATQITQQLTETKNEDIFEIYDTDNFVRPLTKTIETSTFKPINAQNTYNFALDTYNGYVAQNLSPHAPATQLAVDYIATFGYIGVKRPEIFEAGRKLHYEINESPNQPHIYDSHGHFVSLPDQADEGFTTVGDRPVANAQTANENTTFTLGILYNETTLGLIRDLFDAQALYPELWDNLQDTFAYSDAALTVPVTVPPTPPLVRPTINNSRFLHMNKYASLLASSPKNESFGDDAFTQRPHPNNVEMSTQPVFFKYDDDKRDYYVPPEEYTSIAVNGLVYGFAYPVKYTNHDVFGGNPHTIYLIGITNGGVGGTPRNLFSENTTPVDPNFRSIEQGRKIGFDFHATAYSTAIITPFSGYTNSDIGVQAVAHHNAGADLTFQYPTQINWIRSTGNAANLTDINPYMTMSYIGANNPAINYNTTTNRFELSRFHTGNNTGNKATAGNPSPFVNSKSMTPPQLTTERLIAPATVNQDAGNTVYKINPRPPQFGYSPTFKPYARLNQAYRIQPYPDDADTALASINATGANTIKYDGMNQNIEPYKIFDSHGGIYIEDWGFDASNWEDNLWDILGFDYDAVNAPPSSKNVLTKRVDNENSNLLYRPTTNAEVVQTDTKNYVTNQFGAVMYYNSLPYPTCVPQYVAINQSGYKQWRYAGNAVPATPHEFIPANTIPLELWNEVTVLTESTTITATDIQKSVLRPYYTIRSNILEGATALGGNPTGANLPIISIVDKYSAASDYFLGNPSNIDFTVTKPTMVADITTSIHDSDGEYANVDKTSAVIYKITKLKRTPPSIIEEILDESNEKNKKNKK
tara:strand:- start:4125 stop:7364 length:3240 start_codon:yes stop_codon:yes gene_type:complete